jgi:hypothetical protein
MIGDNLLSPQHLRFFLAGSTALNMKNPRPNTANENNWLVENMWKDIESLNYQVNDIFNYIGGNINEENKNLINENPKLNKAELYDAYLFTRFI